MNDPVVYVEFPSLAPPLFLLPAGDGAHSETGSLQALLSRGLERISEAERSV